MSSERGLATVPAPPMHPLRHCFNSEGKPNAEILRIHLLEGGRLTIEDAMKLIVGADKLLRMEPNVLELEDPITVCGDVHGQYYDLMTLLSIGGDPEVTQYLFLGDYVDRGCFSTEVALYLFSLKILSPTRLWMLRGNHECRHLTSYFNFREECLHKYNQDVYDAFQNAFDALPLAAVLSKSFLCLHGGLSPEIKSVDDISLIDRFTEPPTTGPMCDVLWADPMEEEEEHLCPDALFLHNEQRGCSYVFSFAAVQQFLKDNGLLSLIRAHEAQDEGFRMFRKIMDSGFPGVICIFSAPNYCDTYDNKASILQITDKVLHIRQFHSVEHPYVLPNFMNAFSWSLPFVYDKIFDVVTMLTGGSSSTDNNNSAALKFLDEKCKETFLSRRGRTVLAKVLAVARFMCLLRKLRRVRRK